MDAASQTRALPAWLQSLYPFQTGEVAIGGERMSYACEGPADAPPLLLLHGSPAWSFVWRNVIPRVSGKFRVVAPDLLGFGQSSRPEGLTLERHVDSIAQLMDALGLKGVTLAGNGLGGAVAVGLALREPENVSRIVLMNTWLGPASAVQRSTPSLLAKLLPASFEREISGLCARRLTAEEKRGYAFGGDGASAAVSDAQIREEMNLLRAPVEILWGARDPLLPGKLLPYLLRDSLPNVRKVRVLEDASHLVPEDAPEVVAEELLSVFKPKAATPVFNILK